MKGIIVHFLSSNNNNETKPNSGPSTKTWFTDLPMRFAWLVTSDLSNLKKYIVSPGEIHQPVCIQNILLLHTKSGKWYTSFIYGNFTYKYSYTLKASGDP